jgi:hypothetical protein
MMKPTNIGIAVLLAGTVSLLLVNPTYADVGNNSVEIGTHKVWLPNQSIFKLKRFGEFCMPSQFIKGPIPQGTIIVGMETKECPNIPQRFRKVVYQNYWGWMWDYSLEVIDPFEGHLPPTDNQINTAMAKEEDTEPVSIPPTPEPLEDDPDPLEDNEQ